MCDSSHLMEGQSKNKSTKTTAQESDHGAKVTPSTSLQQKGDKKIQDLRKRIKSLESELTDRESDLKDASQQNKELREQLKGLESQLTILDKQHDNVTTALESLSEKYEKMEQTLENKMARITELESQITDLTEEQIQREKVHERRYLELYQKGQAAVLIEQEEELVRRFAMEKGDPLTQKLVEKLLRTERKLEKLKDSKREEIYKKCSPNVPSVDHAKMGMLKSAFFYYLTGREKDGNLEMIMTLLEFSDKHREKIKLALKDKKVKL